MEEVRNRTLPGLEPAKREQVYSCPLKLVRGMTDEDAKAFDSSYQRAKRVLRRINEYATKQYLNILKEEENLQALNIPNYSEYIAAKMAQRGVWREVQELTRTK